MAILLVIGFVPAFFALLALVDVIRGPSSQHAAPVTPPAASPLNPAPSAPSTPGSPSAPSTSTVPPDPSAGVLRGLVIQQSDVGPTVRIVPLPGGEDAHNVATLDLCQGDFPSESLRTARLQVAAVDAQDNALLSTEAVLYRNAAATAQGFTELRATPSKCSPTPAGPDSGPTSTRFNPAPDAAWAQTPTVERLAFDVVSTDAPSPPSHTVAVYLRRGRALLGLYFAQPDGPQGPVAGQSKIDAIVTVFAQRLAQLPPSVVNAG